MGVAYNQVRLIVRNLRYNIFLYWSELAAPQMFLSPHVVLLAKSLDTTGLQPRDADILARALKLVVT